MASSAGVLSLPLQGMPAAHLLGLRRKPALQARRHWKLIRDWSVSAAQANPARNARAGSVPTAAYGSGTAPTARRKSTSRPAHSTIHRGWSRPDTSGPGPARPFFKIAEDELSLRRSANRRLRSAESKRWAEMFESRRQRDHSSPFNSFGYGAKLELKKTPLPWVAALYTPTVKDCFTEPPPRMQAVSRLFMLVAAAFLDGIASPVQKRTGKPAPLQPVPGSGAEPARRHLRQFHSRVIST
jgi:hypothetical protein